MTQIGVVVDRVWCVVYGHVVQEATMLQSQHDRVCVKDTWYVSTKRGWYIDGCQNERSLRKRGQGSIGYLLL